MHIPFAVNIFFLSPATLRPDKETTRVIRSCGFLEESRFELGEV